MRLRLVLVRPEQPRNAGAVLRAVANFGAERLRIADVFPWTAEQLRESQVASSGAWEVLGAPVFTDTMAEAVSDCSFVIGSTARQRDEEVAVETPAGLFARLSEAKGTAALLLGPESTGLTADDLMQCHAVVRIPSVQVFPSLNLAQAAAILLYEWQAAQRQTETGQAREAPSDVCRQEAVLALWSELLAASGEWPESRLRRAEARARRLLHRSSPSDSDLALLATLARKLLRRLRG